jgi:hypothetical protein
MKDAFSVKYRDQLIEMGTDPIERQRLESAQVNGTLDKRGLFALRIGQYFNRFRPEVWPTIDHEHFLANQYKISKAFVLQLVLRSMLTKLMGEGAYVTFVKEMWEREAQRKLRAFDNMDETLTKRVHKRKSDSMSERRNRRHLGKEEEIVPFDVFREPMYLRRTIVAVTQIPNAEFEPLRITKLKGAVELLIVIGNQPTNETIQENREDILKAVTRMQTLAAESWTVVGNKEIDPEKDMNTRKLLGVINRATEKLIGVQLKAQKDSIKKKTSDETVTTKTANTTSGETTRNKQVKVIPYEFDQIQDMFGLLDQLQVHSRLTKPELDVIQELYRNSETVEEHFLPLFKFYRRIWSENTDSPL